MAITALQTEWSLWARDTEDEIVSTARKRGVGLVPYSPTRARVTLPATA